jgi:hypothetical protein
MTTDASSIADATWRGARKRRREVRESDMRSGRARLLTGRVRQGADGTREVVAPGNYISMPARARAIERKSTRA